MLPMLATPPPSPPAIVEYVVPVTVECVLSASKYYKIPVALLAGIMSAEGGEVAKYSTNSNGTRDYGPMQINTIWLGELAPYGFTEKTLINNGCANVFAGAWILSKQLAKHSTWDAVGHYHSGTPKLNKKYQQRVALHIRAINKIKDVVTRANRTIFRNMRKEK